MFLSSIGVAFSVDREPVIPYFDESVGGWVVYDEYNNHPIDILITPHFRFCPYNDFLLKTFDNLRYFEYGISGPCINDSPPASYKINFLPNYANHRPDSSDIDFSIAPTYFSHHRFFIPSENYKKGLIDFNIDVFANDLLIKSYEVTLDTTSKGAQNYLITESERYKEILAPENNKRIFTLVILILSAIALIYGITKLLKRFYTYVLEKQIDRKAKARMDYIKKTTEEIALQETIKDELAKVEPDEFKALRLEIAKAISENDREKIDYLLALSERLKQNKPS